MRAIFEVHRNVTCLDARKRCPVCSYWLEHDHDEALGDNGARRGGFVLLPEPDKGCGPGPDGDER